jgi:hypothetical protein
VGIDRHETAVARGITIKVSQEIAASSSAGHLR